MPASSAVSDVLRRLAASTGGEPVAASTHDAHDLRGDAPIASLAAAWLAPRLATAAADPQRAERVRRALARLAGRADDRVAFAVDHAAALRLAAAGARPGPAVVVGGSPWPAPDATRLPLGAFADATPALAGAGVLVVEPWLPDAADAGALRALLATAKARGVRTVVDEARTALRAAATTARATHGLGADAVVVGPALAGGLPFAAAIGASVDDAAAPAAATLAVVDATLADDGVAAHAAVAAAATRLRAAVDRAAAREQLAIRWRGPAAMPELCFDGQEDAPGALIGEHFVRELADAGAMAAGPLALAGDDDAAAALAPAFDRALVRIRVLLVEYNSYLSGELPFAFPGGDATLRARGACIYRYPRRGKVLVAPAPGGGIRIAFAPSQLGAVTSSGFYVPTALRGDVDAIARYTLRRWEAGPDSACLGLFVQNAASTARYYAQVMSTADRPHVRDVAAGLAGVVSARQSAPADDGWLRIQREGDVVRAFHRATADAPWTPLGETRGAPADDLFVGAKIWSKDRTDGLVADITDLTIAGAVAPTQEPLLGPRPDPNAATAS